MSGNNSTNGSGTRPLQPKPVAVSPIRPIQGMVAQNLMPRIASGPQLMQPVGPNQQLVLNAISQQAFATSQPRMATKMPINLSQSGLTAINLSQPRFAQVSVSQSRVTAMTMSQPRMSSQVIQQSAQPQMTMYVQPSQATGQTGQQSLPKIVTGVPVYQNNASFPGGHRLTAQQGQIQQAMQLQQAAHLQQAQKVQQAQIAQAQNMQAQAQNMQAQAHVQNMQAQAHVQSMQAQAQAQNLQAQVQNMQAQAHVQNMQAQAQAQNLQAQVKDAAKNAANSLRVSNATSLKAGAPFQLQPQMTLAVQTGQGQYQQISASQLRPAHYLHTGQTLPGQIIYRTAGPMTTLGYAGLQLHSMQAVSQGQATSQGKTTPTSSSAGQPTSTTSQAIVVSASTQMQAVSQMGSPQFFTSMPGTSTHTLTTHPGSLTPVSPLVPLSPSMFQVKHNLIKVMPPTCLMFSSPGVPPPPPPLISFGSSPVTMATMSSASITSPVTSQIPVVASTTPILIVPSLKTAEPSSSTSALLTAAQQPTTSETNTPESEQLKLTESIDDRQGIPKLVPEMNKGSKSEDKSDRVTSPVDCSPPSHPSHEMSAEEAESFRENVLKLRQNKDPSRHLGAVDSLSWTSSRESRESSINSLKTDDGSTERNQHEDEDDKMSWAEEQGEEDEEFVWEEYLQSIGASAVPPTAFKHVESSLQSGFVKGMKLEVRNPKSDPVTYWVASVIMTCGPLLRLRYDGYENDSSGDFWSDLSTSEIHPIGWCAQNGQNLQPPEEIKDKFQNWREFLMTSLTGSRTAPSFLLDKGVGSTPIDQLKQGIILELQEARQPLHVWFVQVVENVGGRLYLRLEGTESSKHFWMFYLNDRLHPLGWANMDEGYVYKPPKEILEEHSEEEWMSIQDTILKDKDQSMLPIDVFKDQVEIQTHRFEVGMKLEALYPGQSVIGPATVVKVINSKYFLVQIDDLRPKEERETIQMCCHLEYLGIFPVNWCQCKGIRITSPPGWKDTDFVWSEYLSFSSAKAAPEKLFASGTDEHEFERGMKLEAVNPDNENQICAATITKIVGPLLWIHLDNFKNIPSHIEDIDSHNLFPVGWCESNGFQLKPPIKTRVDKRQQRRFSVISQSLQGDAYRSETYSHVRLGHEGSLTGSWCPTIYFNHRCFSGPYLSKGRIAELPKSVGPGPMGLVLKEVLSLLINVAYKSCKVLKELQVEGQHNPAMQPFMLKAKYKGKTYRGVVEVCRKEGQLEEFCRQVCIKLECCPYLFSPLFVEDVCPENCQQLTKTKYNYNYGKKKKKPVGRPPLHHSTSENGGKVHQKRGRKKKRFHLIHKKTHSVPTASSSMYRDHYNSNRDEGFIDDDKSVEDDYIEDVVTPSKKRKYTHHIPPPSDIQTRGAKLPKYSFERKTHKKILLSHPGTSMKSKDRLKMNSQRSAERVYRDSTSDRVLLPRDESLRLDTNPLHWSINDVVNFIKNTDCAHLARIIKEQEIDGQALLLLNLSTIQEHLELKLGPAVKLCHQIERLKVAFFESYA